MLLSVTCKSIAPVPTVELWVQALSRPADFIGKSESLLIQSIRLPSYRVMKRARKEKWNQIGLGLNLDSTNSHVGGH